jgi:hypothetical protein
MPTVSSKEKQNLKNIIRIKTNAPLNGSSYCIRNGSLGHQKLSRNSNGFMETKAYGTMLNTFADYAQA